MTSNLMYKGISELLAIVLGIIITIAIGMTLFTLVPGYLNSLQQQQRIAITGLSISALDDRTAIATINIKNLGTKDVTNITIYISSSSNINYSLSLINKIEDSICISNKNANNTLTCNLSLAPGNEISLVVQLRNQNSSIAIGDRIVVTAIATFIDKSVSTSSTTAYIY